MALWTAFLMGLLGSLHCVGMCGPIALALPYNKTTQWKSIANLLLYNSGRVITYGFLGLLVGALGRGIALAGYQQSLSIALGISLLIVAIFSINVEHKLVNLPFAKHFYGKVREALQQRLNKNGATTLFSIGILNGFLPCGFVYVGLAGAVTTASLFNSMLYMLLFGLGTIPLMLIFSLSAQIIGIKRRRQLTKLIPAFTIIFGVLFIIRGLNLGVPFLSPEIGRIIGSAILCH